MTTEIWGASYGINQAEDQINKNALAGLKAQLALGELAQQPAELRLKEAQTRLFGAQAGKAEEEAKQSGAYKQFVMKAMQDLSTPKPGAPAPKKLEQLYNLNILAVESGFPDQGMTGLKDVTKVMQQEAATAASSARAKSSQLDTQQKLIERMSAETASITTPEQYAGWLAMQTSKGRDVSFMPQSFDASAKQMLNALTMQGIDAAKQIGLQRSALTDAARIKASEASAANSFAQASGAKAREKATKFKLENDEKYLGPTSKATLEAKKAAKKASEESTKSSEVSRELNKRKRMLAESIEFKAPTPAQIENPNNFVDPLIDGKTYFIPGHGAMTWDATTQTMLPFIREK